MITILLVVSRPDFLERVITSIELLECNQTNTNFLCLVDGPDSLFIRARNLVADTKFNSRLTVRLNLPGEQSKLNITERRKRISSIHNEAKKYIEHNEGYVLSVEDDTTFGKQSLKRLLKVANTETAVGIVQGVELGRWGVPYVGAWQADDIYNLTELKSLNAIYPATKDTPISSIDAGGLYCTLIKADLYKQHNFHYENGLGPDINLGLEARQLGYNNYIVWQVPCTHHYMQIKEHKSIHPRDGSKQVTLSKISDTFWRTTY